MPRDRRVLMRKRRKIQNKLLSHEDQPLITKLENQLLEVEAKLKASHETQREHEENLAVSAIKANPKFFYNYAKKKLRTKSKHWAPVGGWQPV